MNQHFRIYPSAVITALGITSSVHGADTSLGQDLKATIALQGLPCDQILSSKRNSDSDYAVTCKDGNRYHVFFNAQGRVIVEKQ